MAPTIILPSPGRANTTSVVTESPISATAQTPVSDTIGSSAGRSEWLSTTTCSRRPLARAVRT